MENILTDAIIAQIMDGETTDYEDVMKYSPYMREGKLPQLETLDVRLKNYQTEFTFPNFTTYCKKIGQPDWAMLHFTVIPDGKIVEMRSLRNYLIACREFDIYQEEISNIIFIDFVNTCKPHYAKLVATWDPRGSMGTVVTIEYSRNGV